MVTNCPLSVLREMTYLSVGVPISRGGAADACATGASGATARARSEAVPAMRVRLMLGGPRFVAIAYIHYTAEAPELRCQPRWRRSPPRGRIGRARAERRGHARPAPVAAGPRHAPPGGPLPAAARPAARRARLRPRPRPRRRAERPRRGDRV